MNIHRVTELMRKYSTCLECGSKDIGGEPSVGTLNISDEVFTRTCKCGWSVVEDHRIKHISTSAKKQGSKVVGGAYEVAIHGQAHKLLPLLVLKEKAGVKRINQHAKIDSWLNSVEGRKWALAVPAETLD